jgi:nicotinate-nucleotide adenylyltransferase
MSQAKRNKAKHTKPIGILGGTFDPIHYGHLKPAQQILTGLGLNEIRLMPSHKPPHKTGTNATSEQRAHMATLACQDMPGFSVDLRELQRHDPSYTVVTLENIRQDLPDTPICFLMGMDSLLSFKSWYRWADILPLCHLVVSYRPGSVLDSQSAIADVLERHQTNDYQQLHQHHRGLIYLAEIEQLDISSSQIRQNIKMGASNQGLMPDAVADFVLTSGLYCSRSVI